MESKTIQPDNSLEPQTEEVPKTVPLEESSAAVVQPAIIPSDAIATPAPTAAKEPQKPSPKKPKKRKPKVPRDVTAPRQPLTGKHVALFLFSSILFTAV